MSKIFKLILFCIVGGLLSLYIALSQRWIASKWFLPNCQSTEVLNKLSQDFLTYFKLNSSDLNIKYEIITEVYDETVKNERACTANITYQITNEASLAVQEISNELSGFNIKFGSVTMEKLSPNYPKINYKVKVDLATKDWFIELTSDHKTSGGGNNQLRLVSKAINDREAIILKAQNDFSLIQKRKFEAEERESARVFENERIRIQNWVVREERERARVEENERRRIQNEKVRDERERARIEENERTRIQNERITKQREVKTFK